MLLGPPAPISVIVPLVVVLSVPPVSEIPWQAPVVPEELAVIAIADAEVEDVEKLADEKKPIPPDPVPWIALVATIFPAVVKAAPTLIPLPPVAPPMHEENVQVPVVRDVQAPLIATP